MAEQQDRFFIPKTIRVGYQERSDTYTNKLAYIIYIDQLGKVRKEASWNNWRQHKFEPNDFENVPTEGFVLNKHAGGYKSGWNYRQSYCRVYDPRGFEFEITIDNLLWILDWEDCLHGKGLSGKFVYGWIYDQLCLIPCSTEDYKVSQEVSDKMYGDANLSKDDLVPGASYKVKNEDHPLVFIGNLKIQNKLGKGYKSQLYFFDSEPPKYSHYAYKANSIIAINKNSILCKIADDAISKEKLDDILHKFNLTAYSHDFWHTKNIIKEFTSEIPNCGHSVAMNHCRYRYSWEEKLNVFGIIAEDGKSVTILKRKTDFIKERIQCSGGYRSYIDFKKTARYYKFINLNTECDVEKIGDLGQFSEPNEYYYERTGDDITTDIVYPAKSKTSAYNLQYVDDAKGGNLYYVTNDGYISNSLMEILLDDSLSYVDNTKSSYATEIILPEKL